MQKIKYKIRYVAIAFAILLVSSCNLFGAGLTFQGPTGFLMTPSHKTIPEKQIDMAIHTRMYKVPVTKKEGWLTSMAFGFSPFKDAEFGVQKTLDSRKGAHDPDPTLNFKVVLPSIGEDEFSQIAFGGVFDTNSNNYHTLYLSIAGLGVGWNFGGNPGGMASYGKFKSSRDKPQSFVLFFGAELPGRTPGERGYKTQTYVDYNGDVVSLGWRYRSHRGFWAETSFQTKSSSYKEFYDYKPFIIGLGANF